MSLIRYSQGWACSLKASIEFVFLFKKVIHQGLANPNHLWAARAGVRVSYREIEVIHCRWTWINALEIRHVDLKWCVSWFGIQTSLFTDIFDLLTALSSSSPTVINTDTSLTPPFRVASIILDYLARLEWYRTQRIKANSHILDVA